MAEATFTQALGRYAAMTDSALEKALADPGCAAKLHDAMAYSVRAGGKRLRPAMCLAACELCGGTAERALPAAAAIELIHTYSLIHDDLPAMDDDDLRRGKPSCHIAFGEANAILAGDGLQALAFLTLAESHLPEAAQEIARGALDMVSGQCLDLDSEMGEEALTRIHRLKTGALFLAAVRAGARSAGAAGAALGVLTAFAERFGLLFQITDDILDATGETAKLGKTVEKDADAGKTTFVTCYGLPRAREMAALTAADALMALEPFGTDADFFRTLTRTMLTRLS